MKILRIFLIALALFAATDAFFPRLAQAREEVSFEFFYDNLSPYGEWIEVGDYGYCWHPRDVDENWRPYADGYWAYTDEGWTWVSYEDFGWITYHYGRWAYADDVGWFWRPDYTWAPAWVSWRYSDEYVGWAPLPPECDWRPGVGVSIWVDTAFGIGPHWYNFCPVASFASPFLAPVIVDRSRNVTIIQNTVNITNITVNNGVVYNGGPRYAVLAAHSKRPIPMLHLNRVASLPPGGKHLATAAAGTLTVHAPIVSPNTAGLKPAQVAKKIETPKIDKGWAKIDPAQKQKIEQKFKTQTKGITPENHPAKPIAVSEIKAVQQKVGALNPGPTPGKVKKSLNESPLTPANEEKMSGEKNKKPLEETGINTGGKKLKGKATPMIEPPVNIEEKKSKAGEGKKTGNAPLEPFTGGEPKTGKMKNEIAEPTPRPRVKEFVEPTPKPRVKHVDDAVNQNLQNEMRKKQIQQQEIQHVQKPIVTPMPKSQHVPQPVPQQKVQPGPQEKAVPQQQQSGGKGKGKPTPPPF